MAHIPIPNDLPGISGLLTGFPVTGGWLSGLAQELLRGESTLTPFERELIAVRVSRGNRCVFCSKSHAAAACALSPEGTGIIKAALEDDLSPEISDKMRCLLDIAEKVRQDGKLVTAEDIDAAHSVGATDDEIHRTVLIAAAFCMYNRYVDGLHTFQPNDDEAYIPMGERLATEGYTRGSASK